MKLSHEELVRLSLIYMLSSDPLVYNNAWNQIRDNAKENESVSAQEWYKEALRVLYRIENSLLWKGRF